MTMDTKFKREGTIIIVLVEIFLAGTKISCHCIEYLYVIVHVCILHSSVFLFHGHLRIHSNLYGCVVSVYVASSQRLTRYTHVHKQLHHLGCEFVWLVVFF